MSETLLARVETLVGRDGTQGGSSDGHRAASGSGDVAVGSGSGDVGSGDVAVGSGSVGVGVGVRGESGDVGVGRRGDGPGGRFIAALDEILRHFDGAVGTLHGLDPSDALLVLVAERGLPPGLRAKVERIPIGKGMAGLAAERRAPVQVCNLQTDESGVARPSARETQVAGSITVPLLDGGALRGTLGIAKPIPHEFSPEETDLLLACGAAIARALPR